MYVGWLEEELLIIQYLQPIILNIVILSRPCDHDIACMDAGTYDLFGTKIMTVHPEHKSLGHIMSEAFKRM